ncbi:MULTISPECIES: hypothetical protein [Burkholderia]|uniref:hypothetical protein n=1 Tax=Burkholderia TaxID=32008 RepID=UPI0011AE6BFC|nr:MULTISPECIES: hypothetical protein [Burkholderia]
MVEDRAEQRAENGYRRRNDRLCEPSNVRCKLDGMTPMKIRMPPGDAGGQRHGPVVSIAGGKNGTKPE